MKLTPALKLSLCLLGSTALSFAQDAEPAAETAPAETYTEAQVLETFGWYVGSQVGATELEFDAAQKAALLKGFTQALEGQPVPVALEKIGPQVQAFLGAKQQAYQEKAAAKGKAEAAEFFAGIKAKDGVQSVEATNREGEKDTLYYEIIKEGDGPMPKATDTVKVHYTGKLVDGTTFDSSVDRGEPIEFPLNEVIPGWTEGLQHVKQGGKIKLYVSSVLGYGERGSPPVIPPNSTLVFDVELLDIITPEAE